MKPSLLNNVTRETQFDLADLPAWLVERGMLGLPLDEQICEFCQKISLAGFPMNRVQMGMSTLHPIYGSHTFVWRKGSNTVEHTPREHAVLKDDIYRKSPVHYMRSKGVLSLRRRIDRVEPDEFPIFTELRSEGLVDYAAHIVPFDHQQVERISSTTDGSGQELGGIFFSCATDRSAGFDEQQLVQVFEALPYLALSVKSRLTYDIANTVLGTYLGSDASHRVLAGEIERGSVKAIRAVVWFSDLRGFTTLTDTLPRQELIEALDDYLEAMASPVHDNNGQVLKIMGDGLLAIFDLTGRDDKEVCRQALIAADELCAAFPPFNKERRAAGKPTMDFGLGLHMGEVLYGNIGASSDRLDFTVIGPAVNEASRIQSLCKTLDRNVLVSSSLHAVVGSGYKLEHLGSHTLRGVRKPQELFGLPR